MERSGEQKLKVNLILQSFYQVLIVLTPLLTSPYISRVLGADNLGIYSFTYGIVNYFTIFANLGTQNYGSRSIAQCGDDREKRSKCFSEIIVMQWSASLIALIGYFTYLAVFDVDYPVIALLQTIYIAVSFAKIDWLFFGLEEFKKTVGRNVLIKALCIICIFTFVRSSDSLWIYIVIMAGCDLLGQIIMIPTVKKYVDFKMPKARDILPHVKPNLILFIPSIAYSLNHVLDKTMIGIFSNYTQNGYYYNVEKIINIPKGVITGIGVVMMPRISQNVAKGEQITNQSYIRRFLYVIMFLSVGMAFGLSAVSSDFVPLFFGPGYDGCISLLSVMSFSLIFMSLSDMFRTQYLIPNKRDIVYTVAMFVGAGFNVSLNAFLIPKYGAMGAVIGTIVAECIACMIQFYAVNSKIKLLSDFLRTIPFVACGIVMYFVIKIVSTLLADCSAIITVAVEIFVGFCVYSVLAALCLCFFNRSILKELWHSLITMLKFKKDK